MWVLFSDAARVPLRDLRADAGRCIRLLALGLPLTVLIGWALAAWLLREAESRGWAAEELSGVAVLGLAAAAYATALVVHGNGFVAAFCGGLTFGATAGRRGPAELGFTEQAGTLLGLIVWLAFGAVAVLFDNASWITLLYAVLSLTVIRMVPVAVVTIGTTMDARTLLFVGWFGPRGLASLVFALITLEELGPAADDAVTVITGAILLSVVIHGISGAPLAARYGRSVGTGERIVTRQG